VSIAAGRKSIGDILKLSDIQEKFLEIRESWGITSAAVYFILLVIISLNHWSILPLPNWTIPLTEWKFYLVDLFYIYVIINSLGITVVMYDQIRLYQHKDKICYKCGKKLEYTGLKCPECGTIKYTKDKK